MPPVPPPNLFDFATSELSQDAFLCWLIAWADPSLADADATLHRTGRALLSQLLAKHGLELPGSGSAASATSAASVKVSRQFEHIDVLATIGETIVLAIEDKTDTVNHSQQLDRYRDVVEEYFPDRQHALIYLKTGDQSSYRAVEAKGWRVFDRTDLLAILRPARPQTTNAILVDFLDHLEGIERQVRAFATAPPSDWDAMAWKGFFGALRDELDGTWAYVPNPTGGFMGFWWGFNEIAGGELYLQLEQDKLVVKVAVDDRARRREIRDAWVTRALAELSSMGFERPARLGHGTYMTVAVLDADYRHHENGRLDLERTLAQLRQATCEVARLARAQS